VVPLDVTQLVVFTLDDAADLERAGATFAAELLRARIELQANAVGAGTGGWVHDADAAALVVDPQLAGWRSIALAVETEGDTAGAAIIAGDRRATVRVAVDVDAAGIRAAILGRLSSIAIP
jgi:inosine-uridine nucleoside N-ribohydrolase